ncbi:amidohydrolase family protein [Streptococcus dentapri]|uniref:Amidohydrolase family protein n=1 Tax=Streptococcus dentapri TaxID=573564 RepID=A0ABV8D386_9STRE
MSATIIRNVRLIHLETAAIDSTHIFINKQGIIEKISPVLPDDFEHYHIIEGNNHFVLPGLINLHAHLFGNGNALSAPSTPFLKHLTFRLINTQLGKNWLRSIMRKNAQTELQTGVTTIRVVGEGLYQDILLRQQINHGEFIGPTLKASGPMLSAKDGHGTPFVARESTSISDYIQNCHQNIESGVDWIKICITGGVTDAKALGQAGQVQIPLGEVEAICQEAHKHDILVAAHAESTKGIRIALKAGVDSIEHGFSMDEEIIQLFKNNPKAYRGYSVLVPTFSPAIPFVKLSRKDLGVTELVYQNGKAIYQGMLKGFHQALQNNITIGIGNDASMTLVTHYDFWRELVYCKKLGKLSNQDVLKMATSGNAHILGVEDEYGTIAVGKIADVILLEQNPLENLKALKTISLVIKKGIPVDKTQLPKLKKVDRLLEKMDDKA